MNGWACMANITTMYGYPRSLTTGFVTAQCRSGQCCSLTIKWSLVQIQLMKGMKWEKGQVKKNKQTTGCSLPSCASRVQRLMSVPCCTGRSTKAAQHHPDPQGASSGAGLRFHYNWFQHQQPYVCCCFVSGVLTVHCIYLFLTKEHSGLKSPLDATGKKGREHCSFCYRFLFISF